MQENKFEVVQLVERRTVNAKVGGSTPPLGTNIKEKK